MNLANDSNARRSASLVESAPTQQQFLRFTIQPDLVALMEIEARIGQRCQQVTELVNIPIDRVVPMPHLPPTVMGVYNWRGEILWIVDLAKVLGLDTSTRNHRSLQPTIVLTSSIDGDVNSGGEDRSVNTLGLVVDAIADIERYSLETTHIPAPNYIYPELLPWSRGVWQSVTGENLLVLDGQAILDRADLDADV